MAASAPGEPLLRKLVHEIGEPHPSRAKQVGAGHAQVLEEELRRVIAVQADLVEVAAALEAFVAGLDQEQ